jgi:mannan polymerase II complex ANP1 subunit
MQEMEAEKKQREEEEAQKAAQQAKLQEEFRNPRAEWEVDGAALHDLMQKEKDAATQHAGSEDGPVAKPGKDLPKDKT